MFISPLAILLCGKPIQAIISACVYVAAFFGLFLFFFPGVILWLVGVIHAVMVINEQKANKRNQELVNALKSSTQAAT